jgi:hypothetical protein
MGKDYHLLEKEVRHKVRQRWEALRRTIRYQEDFMEGIRKTIARLVQDYRDGFRRL